MVISPKNRRLRRPRKSELLPDLRSRPAGRFLGEMTTPTRPAESLATAVLSRDFHSKFYFTGQHSPTIKIRAPAHTAAQLLSIFPRNISNGHRVSKIRTLKVLLSHEYSVYAGARILIVGLC